MASPGLCCLIAAMNRTETAVTIVPRPAMGSASVIVPSSGPGLSHHDFRGGNHRRTGLRMTDNRNLATLPLIGAQSKRVEANGRAWRDARSPDHVGAGVPEWGI
jgi:hypothetical protein